MSRAPPVTLPGSGFPGRGREAFTLQLLCACRQLLLIEHAEIDGVHRQRHKTRVAGGIGQHATGKGEQQPRRFCEQESMGVFIGNIANANQPAIAQLDDVERALFAGGGGFDLQFNLVNFAVDLVRADVELQVDLRLIGPLETGRCAGVFDRQIFDILRDNSGRRAIVESVRACCGVEIEVGENVAFVGHDDAFCKYVTLAAARC